VQGCGINVAISTLKGETLLKRYVRLAGAEESPGQDFEAMLATILEEEGFSAEGQEEALS
jgi:hypothetical protein